MEVQPLPPECQAKLIKRLRDKSQLVAYLVVWLMAYVDRNANVLPYSAAAQKQAYEALDACLKRIDESPQIDYLLQTFSGWDSWKMLSRHVREQLKPIEIEVSKGAPWKGVPWTRVETRTKGRKGHPRDERRHAVGVVVAAAFRYTNIPLSNSSSSRFAGVYTDVCEALEMPPPTRWDRSSLEACIRDSRNFVVAMKSNRQMDEETADITVKAFPEEG